MECKLIFVTEHEKRWNRLKGWREFPLAMLWNTSLYRSHAWKEAKATIDYYKFGHPILIHVTVVAIGSQYLLLLCKPHNMCRWITLVLSRRRKCSFSQSYWALKFSLILYLTNFKLSSAASPHVCRVGAVRNAGAYLSCAVLARWNLEINHALAPTVMH